MGYECGTKLVLRLRYKLIREAQAATSFMQTRNLIYGGYIGLPTTRQINLGPTATEVMPIMHCIIIRRDNNSVNTKLSATETLTFHILPSLDIRSILAYDNTTVKDHLYYSANHYAASATNGEINEIRTNYEKIVTSTTTNYNRTFGNHAVQVMIGFETEKNKTDYTRATGTNLPTSKLHTVSTAGTYSAAGYN